MKKVIIMRPDGMDGCTWYRLKQFALIARKKKLLDARFLEINSLSVDQLTEALNKTDAFLCRLSDGTAYQLLDDINVFKLGKPVILDIDDNYDTVDPLSDFYLVYGTKEVKMSNGKYLWKDGEDGFSIKANQKRLDNYHQILKKATAVIVTTFQLKNYAEKFNKNVVIIPNSIDFDIFPKVKAEKTKDEIRICFMGGSSHFPDLIEIAPVLGQVMREYPNTHFYFYGVPFEAIINYLPKDRVHTADWIMADGHGYRMACVNADIGIAPLKDITFNYHKSSIRFYEFGALSVPIIGRNIPPYTDDIRHNHNGMLYKNVQEFYDQLVELIKDPIKRLTIGNNAYEYVKKNRDINEITVDWANFLNGVIGAYENTTVQPKP
jgi:glycosyltransferase involved in cell wall biosynthesis